MKIRKRQLALYVDCEKHARFRRVAVSRNMAIGTLLCEIVDQAVIDPTPSDTEMLTAIAGCQRTIEYQTFALNAPLKCHHNANLLTIMRDICRAKLLEAGQ